MSDGWQPIETAPLDKYVDFDLWVVEGDRGYRMTDCYRQSDGRWYNSELYYGDGDYIEDGSALVTHWMPLPEPPK